MARATPDPVQESPDQIADELDDILGRISSNIDELVDMVKPASIAKRQAARVKAYFVDEQTGLRYEHVVPVVVGTVATVAGIVVLRRLLK